MSENLQKQEKLVFNIVQEYLNKNRSFNAHNIISFINSRVAGTSINLNNSGIKVILNSLLKKNLIVERSKLTKKNVLLNSNRNKIYGFIKNNPGVHFNKLFKKLNLSIAVVEWHLNILSKFKFIKKEKIDNFEAYFEISVDSGQSKIIHIISREKYRKIIEYLKNKVEGCTRNQICKDLGIHPITIAKYINKLDEFCFLFKEKISNKTLYFLKEEYYNI